jgi:hypothetical protein
MWIPFVILLSLAGNVPERPNQYISTLLQSDKVFETKAECMDKVAEGVKHYTMGAPEGMTVIGKCFNLPISKGV